MAVVKLFDIDESTLSENSREKLRIYRSIFEGLEPDRLYILNQMCNMFEVANAAYREVASIGKFSDAATGIGATGCLAQQVMVHFDILKETYKCSESELIQKIDATSKWLKDKGWYGLPEPNDENGCRHIKTADGLVSDMRKYIGLYEQLRKQCEEAKKLAGGKK